ncbi:TldD/PmbA family protein [Limnofasciculus baicalensis]|uniref:TldD/PmbA family protein n=1 Tax=Limnofasciculus baicalensis BBK-W-15 TaxID=2699891 RepID=A0AAE3GYR0_9CYAN|nr:TldD/PmbA family protein [Limnofasciculus baicalensis]MCP2732288.1 TldD/PmbA family protein [Limnofasciculus baicalensis BBK-W-15]
MTIATDPTLLSQDEALSLVKSTIKQSQAEGVFVSLNASESALSRFSENQISQNISRNRFTLTITSYFGKRSASASTTEINSYAITETIRRSEELARIAPEDPEWVPLLEPQEYDPRLPAFDENTVNLSPLARGEIVQRVTKLAEQAGVEGSGTLSTKAFVDVIGNSRGLRACDRGTEADFSFTARIEDGSSWGQRTGFAIASLPIESMTEELIERAFSSRHPREVSPGVYPVIFNPAAFADLLGWTIWNLDGRAADEGRSFMSRTDEAGTSAGNRVGEQIFSPLVQVQRNPAHPLLQLGTCFGDGLSNRYTEVIKDGIPQTLSYSRYWAEQQGKEPTGNLFPIVMTGSDRSLADLIAQTERAILVSRAWYVRYINPRTLEVTGMTRDGTFWIEDGKIAYPIKNLRFNQSLPDMLRDVDALSRVERLGNSIVPGVRVKAFNFSSVTDSI